MIWIVAIAAVAPQCTAGSPPGQRIAGDHTPGAMRWAGGIVVEPRYAADIVVGAQADGLEVTS